MSYLKDSMFDDFRQINYNYVCSDCFTEPEIKKYIIENAKNNYCDYCKNTSKNAISCPLVDVVKLVYNGIEFFYDNNPEDVPIPYDPDDKDFVVDPIDTNEILSDWYITDNDDLMQDIVGSIVHNDWWDKDFWGDSEDKYIMSSWRSFSHSAKHKRRFFININDELFEYFDFIFRKYELFTKIKTGSIIYRARSHDNDVTYISSEDLGTVKAEKAKYSNRMSPAGIPMFYGSFDKETAILEVFDHSSHNGRTAVTIAEFKTLTNLNLIDFSKLPQIPSPLGPKKNEIHRVKFLHDFVRDLSRDIKKDGMEHIEYVPTQILTEMLRYFFNIDNETIDGIIYPSSKSKNGKSIVLFIENQNCCDLSCTNSYESDKYLVLVKSERKILC